MFPDCGREKDEKEKTKNNKMAFGDKTVSQFVGSRHETLQQTQANCGLFFSFLRLIVNKEDKEVTFMLHCKKA